MTTEQGRSEESILTEAEQATLLRCGIYTDYPVPRKEFYNYAPLVRESIHYARMRAAAKPITEVARLLGVSEVHLRQRIDAGTLLGIDDRPAGKGWLIPGFQLTDTGEMPHLGRVLLSAGRPVSVGEMYQFFKSIRDDLEWKSPRDWLLAGRDPSILEYILAGL